MARRPAGLAEGALFAAAVARGTQVLIHDDVLRAPRRSIVKRSNARAAAARARGDAEAFAYAAKLWSCPWCMSVWVAVALSAVWAVWPGAARLLCRVLAASLAAGTADQIGDVLDRLAAEPALPAPPADAPAEVASFLASMEG